MGFLSTGTKQTVHDINNEVSVKWGLMGTLTSKCLACENLHQPKSWPVSLYIYLLSFPRFWTLSIEGISIS